MPSFNVHVNEIAFRECLHGGERVKPFIPKCLEVALAQTWLDSDQPLPNGRVRRSFRGARRREAVWGCMSGCPVMKVKFSSRSMYRAALVAVTASLDYYLPSVSRGIA